MQSRVHQLRQIQTWIGTGQNVLVSEYITRTHGSDKLPSRDPNETPASDTISDDSSCDVPKNVLVNLRKVVTHLR